MSETDALSFGPRTNSAGSTVYASLGVAVNTSDDSDRGTAIGLTRSNVTVTASPITWIPSALLTAQLLSRGSPSLFPARSNSSSNSFQ